MTKAYKLDLEVKGQHRNGIMNVRDTLLIVIHPCAKYGKPMSNQKKSYGLDTKTCQKPYKFYSKVKVQGRSWIMNVRNTSSHGDTPMCQIW